MFTEMINLDADRHRDLCFLPDQPFHFARDRLMVPVVFGELIPVVREMPLIFPVGNELPHALLGARPGENFHVRQSGHWLGRYVPADIRRYPFALAELPPEQQPESAAAKGPQYAMQFDADAPQLSREKGHRLLDDQGQPTDVLRRVQKVLMGLQQEQHRTRAMVREIEAAGLLIERSIHVNPPGNVANDSADQSHQLSGLRVIDEKALAALDGETLSRLRDSEALSLVHLHLLSLSNLADGLIARKLQQGVTEEPLGGFISGGENISF